MPKRGNHDARCPSCRGACGARLAPSGGAGQFLGYEPFTNRSSQQRACRPLPHRARARRRRHGHGLSVRGREARPQGRAQVAQAGTRRGAWR